MDTKNIVTEESLLYRLECSLRKNAGSPPQTPVLQCTQSTLRWLVSEIASGRNPTASQTREYYDLEWKQTDLFHSRDRVPQKVYYRWVMEGLKACSRLRDILWQREILDPVSRYELCVKDVVITGEYAVLWSSRRKRQADVLYLRYGGVKIRPLIPDIVSFARWLDVTNRVAARSWHVHRIGVLHYWVSQNLAARHEPDPEFARHVLLGAAGAICREPFLNVGKHCLTCTSRACRSAMH